MKKQKYSSLGLDVNFSVPETVEEFDKNAKKAGACLAEATNNIVYRGSLAEFRNIFLHGLTAEDIDEAMKAAGYKPIAGIEQITKIVRKTKPVMKDGKAVVRDDETVTEYDESEANFFKRVCAETKKEPSGYQSHGDAVAAMIPFDAAATERKPAGPKKLADKHLTTAKQLIGHKNLPKFLAAHEKAIGSKVDLTNDADGKPLSADAKIEKLGWAIQAYDKWDADQAAKARQAKLLAD